MINISSPPANDSRLNKFFENQLKRTRKASGLVFITALSLCLSSKQSSAQVAVAATAGTTTGTYTTLNDAFAAINAGTHTGVINITINANTTEPATPTPLLASGTAASSYTAINIVPSGNVTINSAASPAASRGIIELAGADNVTINGDDPATAGSQNLSIVAATSSATDVACIRLSSNATTGTDGANNNSIKNCIITGSRNSATTTTYTYGIQFSNGTGTSSSSTGAYSSINTLIENNIITRCFFGIYAIGNSSSYLNAGLIIRNNVLGSATSANNIGIKAIYVNYTASTAGTGSAIISGNDIRVGDYTVGGGNSINLSGIELASTNAGCLINANNIHDVNQPSTNEYGAYGILVSSGTANGSIRITNNFIRDCKMVIYQTTASNAYIPCGVYFTGTPTNVIFNNNTVVMNDQLANSNTYSSFCVNASTSGVTFSQFLNNVLVNNHGSSNAFAFYTGANSALTSAVVNNNDYYVNAASNIGYYNGAPRISLQDWKVATGKDALSINYNPVFTSATDLHIPNGSISFLESAGASVTTTGVTTDFDNQTRPGTSTFGLGTAPDMGADEFDGNVVYTCTTPNPGATLSSTSPLCFGSGTTLSLTTPGSGTGLSYQWQASDDNVTYVDSAVATSATYTITPTKSAYYRCKVTCLNGPAVAYSTPVQIVFTNNITGTTPGTRCGVGTANLSATANSGAVLKWYASPTGSTSLGSGTSFTTPVITATTNYYVEASMPNSGVLGSGATTGTSYDAIFYHYYGGCQSQFLIKASELQAMGLTAGNINSIGINMSTVAPATYAGFAVSMGTTTNTDMSGGLFTGTLNNVFTATSYAPTTGINTFNFPTAFNWDGTSNIIIKFCWSNNNTGGTSNYAKMDNVGFVASAYFRADSQTPATICGGTSGSGTSSNRPQFYFNNVCSSPRVAVAATVTPAPTFTITANTTVCNGSATPLTVTSTAGNFNNYTWTPVTNLFTDAAATVPYTAGTNASTVYAKLTTAGTSAFVANALNTTSQCAAVTSDTLTVMPNAATATANATPICSTGGTTLSLSPTTGYGTGSIKWQTSSDNNTFVDVATGGTAITYTTPSISSTTYYRAAIKNNAGATCFYSVSDTARVYNPLVTATTPGARCDTGSVTLSATGSDGNLKWYAAATGGIPLATGNTFNTPVIGATTTYYVASESGPNGSAAIGTGTTLTSSTGYPTAFGNRWYQDWSQMVYTAAELTAAGVQAGYISGIKLNIGALGSADTVNNYTISLGNTTSNTLTAFTQAVTPAFGPATYTSVVGLNTITFNNPYYWDGTSNIILDIRGKGTNATYNATTTYTTTATNTVVGAFSSSNNPAFYTGNPSSVATATSRLNVIFDQNSCVSTRTPVVATVNPSPVATTIPTGTVAKCEGTITTITASGSGNYQWYNTAGSINGQTNNAYTVNTPGTYKVVVTNATTGCKDTSDAITVYDKLNPVVNLGNDTVFCSGPSLVLNANNTGSTFLWDNFSINQTRTVNNSGHYFVKVTDTANCFTVDTILVVVNPTPVVDLGNDTNLCLGTTYTLDAENTGSAYLWENGTTTQTRNVNNTGNYAVRVTNTYNCTASDSVQVNFLPTPTANLGNDKDACAGITTILDAGNQGITTYLWDNGSTQQTRGVTATGTYYVTVGNVANCKSTDTIKVNYHANPVVNLGNDTTICHDITITLNAQNPGAAYLWDNGSINQTRDVNATGLYNVTVTDAFSCKGSDAIQVNVTPLPSGLINAVHGDTATYTFNVLNAQNVTGYVWNFGDGTTATGAVVQHTYTSNGQYLVTVTFAGMCNDSAINSRTVEVYDVKAPTGIHQINADKELKLYPNPAKETVMIENVSNLSLVHITVYNVVGQTIYDQQADNKVQHKMNTSGFASGVYTVRIETTAGTVIRKFEIQK